MARNFSRTLYYVSTIAIIKMSTNINVLKNAKPSSLNVPLQFIVQVIHLHSDHHSSKKFGEYQLCM